MNISESQLKSILAAGEALASIHRGNPERVTPGQIKHTLDWWDRETAELLAVHSFENLGKN